MNDFRRVTILPCRGAVAVAAGIMSCAAMSYAGDCRAGYGNSISAGEYVVPGDVLPAAVTISGPAVADACSLLVQSLRVWFPDQPADSPDACRSSGGIDVPILGSVVLDPGEFIRFVCLDTEIPDCVDADDVNCERLVDEMCYIVDAGDAVAGGLVFQACWTGVNIGHGPRYAVSLLDTATLINPQIALSCAPEAPDMCSGQPAFVSFTYLVSTGDGDVSLENVQLVDDSCSPPARGADNPGNNNNILEVGELWTYQCSTTLDIPQVTEAMVTATDIFTAHVVSDSEIVPLSAGCAADLTCDGEVGVADLAALLSLWGPCPLSGACVDDIWPQLQDGSVGPAELAAILAAWGLCAP